MTLLAVLLIGAGIMAGCSSLSLGGPRPAATVNGSRISEEQVQMRMALLGLFFGPEMEQPHARANILGQIIREQLLVQEAKKLEIAVTDQTVELELASFLGALDRKLGGRTEALHRLSEIGWENERLAEYLHGYLLAREVLERRQAEIQVPEAHLLAYYEQNKARSYTFPEEAVRASHILIPADQAEFAATVAAKAQAGGDFAELARLYSADPVTNRVGGDLGYFTRGSMAREVADAAFGLKVGEVSQPVKSQFGLHVLLVTDRTGPGEIPFERARADVLNRVLPTLQDAMVSQWLQELERQARIAMAK